MRYVSLLLIFCMAFGVLDSVPRYRGERGISPTASPVLIARAEPSEIAAAHPFVTRRHKSPITAAAAHRAIAAPASVARRATIAAVPTHHPAMEDIAHATVEPVDAVEPTPARDEAIMDNVATPDVEGLSPTAIAMAQASQELETATQDESRSESLADFARQAKDLTATPFLRDSIRNTLMDAHGLQFGGIAGLNWSGASAANTSGKVAGRALTGMTLGIFADAPVTKHLSVRPKVTYQYQGYRPNVDGQPVNIHVAYLHLAPDLVYHTDLLNRRFFVGAGPYIAYALNGTYTVKGIDNDMVFGKNTGANLRHTDLGLGAQAGLLMDRNFVLGVNMDLGIKNIAPDGPTRIHTRSIGVSVMYVFRNRPLF